ncbi:MAG: hypothetical protein QM504_18290 [Pseudomonadota bacterium]
MRCTTLEKLVRTQFNVIGVESKQPSSILDTFRQYNSLTGTPVYIWKKETGLYRLDLSNVKIPQTKTVQQVLNYIIKHQHNSIFILSDFAQQLNNAFIEKSLVNIAKDKNNQKNIFILDESLDLSIKFKGIALETKKLFQMKLQRAA